MSTSTAEATTSEAVPLKGPDWDAEWGLVFGLQNIFQNSAILQGPLGQGNGSVGATFFLAPNLGVRATANISRGYTPEQITRNVVEANSATVETFTYQFPSETWNIGLRGDGIYRLTNSAVAPYLGAGVFYNFSSSAQQGRNSFSVIDQVTTLNAVSASHSLGVRGLVGAEWRIHPHFAIFAEYGLDVTVVQFNRTTSETTVDTTVNNVTSSSRTTSELQTTNWFNFSTGLRQGPTFGLTVFF
jgi:outer membrane protein W